MLRALRTEIDGLLVLQPRVFEDERGIFVKTYQRQAFAEAGIDFEPAEEFFSTSKRGVIRGMHFQLPPAAHSKVVYCIEGAVLDVVLDVRRSSATFGQVVARELNSTNREMFYIPVGCAHGFAALSPVAVMFYQTSTAHSPQHDAGVRWDSFGYAWPISAPIVSARDKGLPPFAELDSPFGAGVE